MPQREDHAPRPFRVLIVLAVLLSGAFAGCLGAKDEGADKPIVPQRDGGDFAVPSRVLKQDEDKKSPNPDPRLNVTAPWYRGDWWYYESNRSRFVRTVVEDIVTFNGVPYYKVRQETGSIGYRPTAATTSIVTQDFKIVNRTTESGRIFYGPANPELRFLPGDNSYAFNESGWAAVSGTVYKWEKKWNVRVVESKPLHMVRVAAGEFNASHFRVSAQITDADGNRIYTFKERYYSPDVRADVVFITKARDYDREQWQLVSYRFKGEQVGPLPAHMRDW